MLLESLDTRQNRKQFLEKTQSAQEVLMEEQMWVVKKKKKALVQVDTHAETY